MITPVNQTAQQAAQERAALERSERDASKSQPESFNDDALTEKIVRIPPVQDDEAPIKGLDP